MKNLTNIEEDIITEIRKKLKNIKKDGVKRIMKNLTNIEKNKRETKKMVTRE